MVREGWIRRKAFRSDLKLLNMSDLSKIAVTRRASL